MRYFPTRFDAGELKKLKGKSRLLTRRHSSRTVIGRHGRQGGFVSKMVSVAEPLGASVVPANPVSRLQPALLGGLIGAALLAASYPAFGAQMANESVVYSFGGSAGDGITPSNELLLAPDGNLYGTTPEGGNYSGGTVFKLSPDDVLTTLHSFGSSADDGTNPSSPLMLGQDGAFYGLAELGAQFGYGTIYKITATGQLTTLYVFGTNSATDGGRPYGALAQTADGTVFGTTLSTIADDGTSASIGAVFSITPAGVLNTLHNFGWSQDGQRPEGLNLASDGNLYGATQFGNSTNSFDAKGNLFKVSPEGTVSGLYDFGTASGDGSHPAGGLTQGPDGALYGVTSDGGSGAGTVFKITLNGQLTTLHAFSTTDGSQPYGKLLFGVDGNLYGTTYAGGLNNGGTIFKLSAGGDFTKVYDFGSTANDGQKPYAGLVQTQDGTLFGVTSAGGIHGHGTVFRLIVPPPAPTDTVASAIDTNITLNWSAAVGATSYSIYQGIAPGDESSTPVATGVTGTSKTFADLSPGVSYYFTIAAVNAAGAGNASSEVSATTVPPAPGTPSAMGADRKITVSWPSAAGATSYSLYQGTNPGGESATPVESGINGTSATVTGLTAGTKYYFTVRALNAAGTSGASPEASATTTATAPSSLNASGGNAKVQLSWTSSSGASSYNIYQGTETGGESATPVLTGVTGTSATISGLGAGIRYYFTVAAVNASGTSNPSAEANAITAPPSPNSLTATGGNAQISLSWAAATGAASYDVYEGITAGGEGSTPIQSGVTGTSTTISGLAAGAAYYFTIVAVNVSGSSGQSPEAHAVTTPASPASLSAVGGNAQVQLSWAATAGANSYNVYAGTASGQEAPTPVLSGVSGTAVTVGGLAAGTRYYFTVAAVGTAGTSAASPEASAIPTSSTAGDSGSGSGGGGGGGGGGAFDLQVLAMLLTCAALRRRTRGHG